VFSKLATNIVLCFLYPCLLSRCSAEAFLRMETRDQTSIWQWPRHAQVPGLECRVRGLCDSWKPAREVQSSSLCFPNFCSAYCHPRYSSQKLYHCFLLPINATVLHPLMCLN